jgi:hypothetical protein
MTAVMCLQYEELRVYVVLCYTGKPGPAAHAVMAAVMRLRYQN